MMRILLPELHDQASKPFIFPSFFILELVRHDIVASINPFPSLLRAYRARLSKGK